MTYGDVCTAYRRRLSAAAALLGLFLLAALPEPVQAQVQGASYTVSPTGQYVFFESDLLGDGESRLENGFLYGGQVGLGFGQYLTLSGEYLLGDGFEVTGDGGGQDVDLKRYGGQVRLNLGNFDFGEAGGFQPFLIGGAGVIEFDPEDLGTTENIYAKAGAGITFSALDRFTLSLSAEGMGYEYVPASTFGVGTPGETETVYVPSARASLAIFLGGQRPGTTTAVDRAIREQFGGGLSNIRIFAEPFYGRIEFNEALKTGGDTGDIPRDQNVAGVNAGIQLGPQVGVRGFYWRGASGEEDVFDEFANDFEDVAFYGGELNLRFGSALAQRSFTPFLILGGGYMDFLSGYEGGTPEDRYFASGGAGVDVPLSDALVLQGSARSLFMSNTDAEDVTTTDQIFGSLMYSAGLKFSFGGGQSRSVDEILEEQRRSDRQRTQSEIEAARESSNADVRRLQARIDSLEAARQQQLVDTEEEARLQEEVRQLEEEVQEEQAMQMQMRQQGQRSQQQRGQQQRSQQQRGQQEQGGQQQGSNLSGQTITVPVPERGEIYIRFGEGASGETQVETVYGPPTVVQGGGGAVSQAPAGQAGGTSGVTAQDIRSIVQQEMSSAGAEGRSLSPEEIAEIVRTEVRTEVRSRGDVDLSTRFLEEQLEDERQERRELQRDLRSLREDLDEDLDNLDERTQRRPPREIVVEEGEDGETTTRTVRGGTGGYQPNSFVPFAGYTVGDANRFLIGARGNYGDDGSSLDLLGFRFAPEAAIGFGDGFSLDLIANGIVDINQLNRLVSAPEALQPYAGLGLGLTTETGIGINLLIGTEYEIGGGAAFVEFGTLDFFDYNRFLIGYRTGF